MLAPARRSGSRSRRHFAPRISWAWMCWRTWCGIFTRACPTMSRARCIALPAFVEEMMKRGWLGEKTGRWILQAREERTAKRKFSRSIWQTMEYRPRQKAKFASIEAGKQLDDTRERLRVLLGPALEGKAATRRIEFLWATLERELSVRGAARAGNSQHDCGRGPGDALGICLGAGAV